MVTFHRLRSEGRSAAEALAATQSQTLGDGDAADVAAAAGFVCFGEG
jgi:hypothetical protein